KAIAVLATQANQEGARGIAGYAGVGKVTGPLPPTVMVPTTGGSGSDVSQVATFLTDPHALTAVRGACEHLLPALDRPGDLRPREGLARASLQAGLAFSNALLGATHAISHQLGGLNDPPHR